ASPTKPSYRFAQGGTGAEGSSLGVRSSARAAAEESTTPDEQRRRSPATSEVRSRLPKMSRFPRRRAEACPAGREEGLAPQRPTAGRMRMSKFSPLYVRFLGARREPAYGVVVG